jgi:hypothetical protein
VRVLATNAIKALDEPVYIPVISDILKAFGVPEFSVLDVVCWIAAVPGTIIYKVIYNKAPFQDNAHTKALLNAASLRELLMVFYNEAAPPAVLQGARPAGAAVTSLSDLNDTTSDLGLMRAFRTMQATEGGQAAYSLFMMIGGVITIIAAGWDFYTVIAPAADNKHSGYSAVAGITSGVMSAVANIIAPWDPLADEDYVWTNLATTAIFVLNLLIFGIAGKANPVKLEQFRNAGAIIDAILVVPAFVCTVKHFTELANKPAGGTRSKAIVYETSNVTSYLTRICTTVALNARGTPVGQGFAVGMAIGGVCTGGLRLAAAFIKPDRPSVIS